MSSQKSMTSADAVRHILGAVSRKGVRLWSENGQLRYQAPRGALSHEEMETLRSSRLQIVALLESGSNTPVVEPILERRTPSMRAPLSFAQLAGWRHGELDRKHSLRGVASAKRLRGQLDIDALCRSLTAMVSRHEALRTRIVSSDGSPVQEITESNDCDLQLKNLEDLTVGSREGAVRQYIERFVLEPVDLADGPLFAARLLRLDANEHVLVLAMDHMISDAFSMNILWRDLSRAYGQAASQLPISLPELTLQFADYADWQHRSQEWWLARHDRYWQQHLAACGRLRFPYEQVPLSSEPLGWAAVPVRIPPELKAELREWCRVRRTTLVMSVFTAYAALVLRWCGVSDAVIRYQTDGRAAPSVQDTIGFFASALHMRIELDVRDTFLELLARLTQEYCNAHSHADFGRLEACVPAPEFTRNGRFNWVSPEPRNDASQAPDAAPTTITYTDLHFGYPMLKQLESDREPSVLLCDSETDVVGNICFPLCRFSTQTMERFRRNFLLFIGTLLRQPDQCIRDLRLL